MISKTNKPSCVFFDWDDTIMCNRKIIESLFEDLLTDYKESIKDQYKNEAKEKLIEIEKHVIDLHFSTPGASFEEIAEIVFEGNHDEISSEMKLRYEKLAKDMTIHYTEGAEDMLKEIKRLQIPTAIISNKPNAVLQEEVKKTPYYDLFFAIIGSGPERKMKPEIDQFLHAEHIYGKKIDRTNAWMVGDSKFDILAGLNYKCNTFFIGTEEHLPESLWRERGTGKFHSLPNKMLDLRKILIQSCNN